MTRLRSDADLLLTDGSIIDTLFKDAGALLPDGVTTYQGLPSTKLKAYDIGLAQISDAFITALKATDLRAIYPQIGAGALDVSNATNNFSVGSYLGVGTSSMVAPSASLPTYSNDPSNAAAYRKWSNLGAVVVPQTDNLLVIKDAAGKNDVINDATGLMVVGRLDYIAAPEDYQIVFNYKNADGSEVALTDVQVKALGKVTVWYKQWVDGNSSLLRDPGAMVFASSAGINATEQLEIDQLAASLGLTLNGTGAKDLPSDYGAETIISRLAKHFAGTMDKHGIDVINVVSGISSEIFTAQDVAAGKTLLDAINKLQTNIDSAGNSAGGAMTTYFDELRSSGILGVSNPLSSAANNQVTAFSAATQDSPAVSYIAGKRDVFVSPTSLAVANSSTVYVWIDANGAIQSGVSYPAAAVPEFAKLGSATADVAGAITIVDDHIPLVELDQKVLDVEASLAAHIAQASGAHAASAVSITSSAKSATLAATADAEAAFVKVAARLKVLEEGGAIAYYAAQATAGQAVIQLPSAVPAGGDNAVQVYLNGQKQIIGQQFTIDATDRSKLDLSGFTLRGSEQIEVLFPKVAV